MKRMDHVFDIFDAGSADLERIVAIYNESVPGRNVTADLEPVTVESRRTWFAEHSPDKRPLWVARQGSEIVGWLSFRSFYGRRAYDSTAELGIYVAASHKAAGVGSQLLDRAIRESPRLSLRCLLGFVFAHNAPSLGLLKKFAFEQWGCLPGVAELDGIERDVVIMGRKV